MKFTNTLVVLCAAMALASPFKDEFSSENDIIMLEKRRSCSGNRLEYEVCQGNLVAQMNSIHNWYVTLGTIFLYSYLYARDIGRDMGPHRVTDRKKRLTNSKATEQMVVVALGARRVIMPRRYPTRRRMERIVDIALRGLVRWRSID